MKKDYKESSVSWIGTIPSNWEIYRIKELFNLKTGGTPDSNEGIVDDPEFNIRWYTAPDFDETYVLKNSDRNITPEAVKVNNYKLFNKNSILVVSIASIGKVALTNEDCYSNQQITALIPKEKEICNSKYLTYCIVAGMDYIKDNALYTTVPIINSQFIGDLKYPLPPMHEQKSIVDHLDSKCSYIDKLISKLEEQIKNLEKFKLSVITECVTTGFNNINLVDTSIDWIGSIPSHWVVKRLKYVAKLKGRIGWQGLTAEEYQNEGPYLITGIDFKDGLIDWDSCVHITEKRWSEALDIQIKNGDLLITKDGTVGKVAIVKNLEGKASLNSGVMVIKLDDKLSKNYLFWVLKSDVFWKWFELNNAGNSTIIHLYQNEFENFSYPIPPIREQEKISDYLEKKIGSVDDSISKLIKQIEIYKRYKKALIYEFITGKKRVEVQ